MRLSIRLASASEPQKKLRKRLLLVLAKHGGLRQWRFTGEVLVDDSVVPHSHPVLTIGWRGRGVATDTSLLSVYLHEQLHWFLSQHRDDLELALKDLKVEYPHVKVGPEEGGARNEESTYLHLLVCLLELDALSTVIGRKRARSFVLRKPYYGWIYREVVSNYDTIERIARNRSLAQ